MAMAGWNPAWQAVRPIVNFGLSQLAERSMAAGDASVEDAIRAGTWAASRAALRGARAVGRGAAAAASLLGSPAVESYGMGGAPLFVPDRPLLGGVARPQLERHLADRRISAAAVVPPLEAPGAGPAGSVKRVTARSVRETPLYAPVRVRPRIEQKYVDTHDLLAAMNTSGFVQSLNGVPQGDGFFRRCGQRVLGTGLVVRAIVYATEYTISAAANLAIVYDKQPTGVVPPVTDIFDSATPYSDQRADTRDRFEVLYRATYVLMGNSTVITNRSVQHLVELNMAFRRMTIYDQSSPSGTLGTMRVGALYLVLMSDNPFSPTTPPNPFFRGSLRYSFVDH